MENAKSLADTIVRLFEEEGFTEIAGKGNNKRHRSFCNEKDDCASVTHDSMSVTYYINGFVDFLSPVTWDEEAEKNVRDEIKRHLWENSAARKQKEIEARLRATLALY